MAETLTVNYFDAADTRLEYIDVGSGEYTLVIESGIGMGVSYWQSLLPDLVQLKVRTIIYSRAGNGQSPQADDVTLATSNNRLHQLLTAVSAGNKLILLGHSYGGLHVRAFAATYPEAVTGLILLDASHEGFDSALRQLDEAWALRDSSTLNNMMREQPEWQQLQRIYQLGAISDNAISQRIPTVVVTSSRLNEGDWWIGHSAEGKRIWRELHQSLIDKNPKSVHFVTEDTGHNIPLDNKKLLLRSIDTLLFLANGV